MRRPGVGDQSQRLSFSFFREVCNLQSCTLHATRCKVRQIHRLIGPHNQYHRDRIVCKGRRLGPPRRSGDSNDAQQPGDKERAAAVIAAILADRQGLHQLTVHNRPPAAQRIFCCASQPPDPQDQRQKQQPRRTDEMKVADKSHCFMHGLNRRAPATQPKDAYCNCFASFCSNRFSYSSVSNSNVRVLTRNRMVTPFS